jgi:hypothetical protein
MTEASGGIPPKSEWKVYRVPIRSGVAYARYVLAPSKEDATEFVGASIENEADWTHYTSEEEWDGGYFETSGPAEEVTDRTAEEMDAVEWEDTSA